MNTVFTFSPGDRVRNWLFHDWLGTVIDDPDIQQGTVAVTYDFSSQVYYVGPSCLELVCKAEED